MSIERTAAAAAARGVRPGLVWHSGKLRAKQTAEAYWRACNALAALLAVPDLQPDDRPERIRNRLYAEPRDLLLAGHYPHLPRLFALLLNDSGCEARFPLHGMVALRTDDGGETWMELWSLAAQ
jgi:phosphohistidine phosphatase